MAKYLVTGGCGFIGSHLVDSLLDDGHRVRVLDNLSTGSRENLSSTSELVIGDVADGKLVSNCIAGMDGCFHLAAVASVQRSTEAWLETHRSNLSGTISVYDAARRLDAAAPVPVVVASSAAVYGACAEMPLAETARLEPLTPYGADKLGCEIHGCVAANMFGVPTTALRFFNVYGPRQDPASPYSGVISIFSNCVAHQRPLTIFGDGHQYRDFIYVADVVRFLRSAMARTTRPVFNVFNVCTGHRSTLNDLTVALSDVCGRSISVRYAPARKGDIRGSVGDPSAAKAALDVEAKTSLRQGLERLLGCKPDCS